MRFEISILRQIFVGCLLAMAGCRQQPANTGEVSGRTPNLNESINVSFVAGDPDGENGPNYSPYAREIPLSPADVSDFGVDPLEGKVEFGWPAGETPAIKIILARSDASIPYDRLYLDADADGEIELDPLVAETIAEDGEYTAIFRPTLKATYIGATGSQVDYPVVIWIRLENGASTPSALYLTRRGFFQARLEIDGLPAFVILSDANNDGVFQEGDWWELLGEPGGNEPRDVGDIAWFNGASYLLQITDPAGKSAVLVPHKSELTEDEDKLSRDIYAADRDVERAATPIPFRSDGKAAVEAAKHSGSRTFLKFETDWCGPCKMMSELVFTAKVVVEATQGVVCVKIDGDEEKFLVEEFEVSGYPTGILLDESGKELRRFEGYQSINDFVAFIRGSTENSEMPQ